MDWNRTPNISYLLATPCHHIPSTPQNSIPSSPIIILSTILWCTMHLHLTPSFVSIRLIYIYTGRTTVAVPKPTHQPITSRVVSQVTSSSCDLSLLQLWLSLFVWPHLGCISHVAHSCVRSSASTAHFPSWALCHYTWLTSYVRLSVCCVCVEIHPLNHPVFVVCFIIMCFMFCLCFLCFVFWTHASLPQNSSSSCCIDFLAPHWWHSRTQVWMMFVHHL